MAYIFLFQALSLVNNGSFNKICDMTKIANFHDYMYGKKSKKYQFLVISYAYSKALEK